VGLTFAGTLHFYTAHFGRYATPDLSNSASL
jgi:hypothetical protein